MRGISRSEVLVALVAATEIAFARSRSRRWFVFSSIPFGAPSLHRGVRRSYGLRDVIHHIRRWIMGKDLSLDIRERVVSLVEEKGHSRREAARRVTTPVPPRHPPCCRTA